MSTLTLRPGTRIEPADLAPTLTPLGGIATAYLPARNAVENTDDRFGIIVKNTLGSLEAAGAGPTLIRRVATELDEIDHTGGATTVVIASADATLLSGTLLDPIDEARVTFGPSASVLPILESYQQSVPHLVVLTDRVGADIVAIEHGQIEHLEEIEGETEHIHRGQPGGWSQRRFQQRAENTWEGNARSVADRLMKLAKEYPPAFIAVSGDVRAVGFLKDHLDDRTAALLVEVRGGGGSVKELAEQVAVQQATVVAARKAALLSHFGDQLHQGAATTGLGDTLSALRQGRVEHLLVSADGDTPEMLWVGSDPMMVARTRDEIAALGQDPTEVFTRDGAVRAALAQHAKVTVVPTHGAHAPDQGLGAILRFAG